MYASRRELLLIVVVALSFGVARFVEAESPRVLPVGEVPNDARLKPLKDLNGYFPFTPAQSADEWEKRAGSLRRQMLVANGLSPLPTKTPLNAVIHGKVELEEYTVERVFFESMPGFYVTGSLYRPKNAMGKRPAVLCPHGHWANGRFYDAGEEGAKEQIAQDAEKLMTGARSPLQARCVQLARMGCVVFFYDMIGYADSQQISFEVAHRFAKQRPEMNSETNWGLYSPQAESHLQSIMGLQTWNSIRSLDFITSLPDVDPKRIGVTGASGGGTQTMILAAIDPRVTSAMPCVMVSTAMQGGCTCENCSLLRVGTGNIEFAAMFAPKPQGLTAADDWTKEMATKGFPELQQHYKLLGAPDNITLVNRIEFKHNYNSVSRAAMYRLFNEHLGLKRAEADLEERDFRILTTEEMTVWSGEHKQPAGGEEFERKLLAWWTADAQQQLADIRLFDRRAFRDYHELVGGGVNAVIGGRLPSADEVEFEQLNKEDRGDYLQMGGLLRNKNAGQELPILFLYPKKWDGTAVIWIDENGKSSLLQKDGTPNPEVAKLIAGGASVVGVDLLYQGEFLKDGQSLEQTPRVNNPREFAGYTQGYNHTVFASRVHDILSVVTFVRNHAYTPKRLCVVGLGTTAGPLVACARAQAGSAIDRAAIDTGGFRFGKVTDIQSPHFQPGGAKYGDLPGILVLSAPDELWLSSDDMQALSHVRSSYLAADAEKKFFEFDGDPNAKLTEIIRWLLRSDS